LVRSFEDATKLDLDDLLLELSEISKMLGASVITLKKTKEIGL
jgi:hypothetical protein